METTKTPIADIAQTVTTLLSQLEKPDYGDDTELLNATYNDMSRLVAILHRAGREITASIGNIMKTAREANQVALGAAFQRVLHGIPGEIRDIQYAIDREQSRYDGKCKALRSEGLNDAQIAAIIQPPSDAEKAEAAAKIEELQAESRALSTFQSSGPKFDYSLLQNTALAYLIPENQPEPELFEAA